MSLLKRRAEALSRLLNEFTIVYQFVSQNTSDRCEGMKRREQVRPTKRFAFGLRFSCTAWKSTMFVHCFVGHSGRKFNLTLNTFDHTFGMLSSIISTEMKCIEMLHIMLSVKYQTFRNVGC